MKFEPKHVVTMVVAVCAASILTPVAVGAVTTQPVAVYDRTGAMAARVTLANGLQVDTRHGAVNRQHVANEKVTGVNRQRTLMGLIPGRILSITEATFSAIAPAGSYVTVELGHYFPGLGGSGGCPAVDAATGTPAGWVYSVEHRVTLAGGGSSIAVPFSDQPLSVTAADPYSCLVVRISSGPASAQAAVSLLAYSN